MIRIPRWLLASLTAFFATFQAFLGFSVLGDSPNKPLTIACLSLYLVAVLATVIFYQGIHLPAAQGLFNVAVAAIVPLIVNSYLDPNQLYPYSTWYVVSIGILMAATALRQQLWMAWIGTAVMVAQVLLWAGIREGIQTGLPGALALVFTGHAISIGLAKAAKDISIFDSALVKSEMVRVANLAASETRRNRIEKTLAGALPMLNLITSQNGKLDTDQKKQATVLEAALRDEIRGRGLMNDEIRTSVKHARERGVEVIILDEGGLESSDEKEKIDILSNVAGQIDGVATGRITLRAPLGEKWRVTLVASRPGISKPDIWSKF